MTVPDICTNCFCPSDLLSWKSEVVEFHVTPVAQNCYMIIFSCKGAWEINFFFNWTKMFLKKNQNYVKGDKRLGLGQAVDSIWFPQRPVSIILASTG